MSIVVWELDIMHSGRVQASSRHYTSDRPLSNHGPSVAENLENTLRQIQQAGNGCRIVALLDHEANDRVRKILVIVEPVSPQEMNRETIKVLLASQPGLYVPGEGPAKE